MGHVYALIKFMKKNHPNVKSVAIVNADDGAVPYLKPLIAKALQENGISVAGDWVLFANEMVDFSPIASKLASVKADAIFHPNGIDRHVGPILKGLRKTGMRDGTSTRACRPVPISRRWPAPAHEK